MDDETQGTKLSESDEQARRLLDITLTLYSSSGPVSSTRIRELHYPHVAPDSFRRMFNRDRQRLGVCGVIVKRSNRPPDEPLWEIDRSASFVHHETLSPKEAILIDLACSQLASDPSFPYSEDLLVALAKVDRAFDPEVPTFVPSVSPKRDRFSSTLEHCLLTHHAARMSYLHADGNEIRRIIALYGMFSLRGNTYVVGPSLDSSGSVVVDSIRTYRIDRFTSCQEQKRITYRIPPDFDIDDYVLLPFQIGPTVYYASFYVPKDVLQDAMRLPDHKVRLDILGEHGVLQAAVSSGINAAAWAIAMGLIPTEPESLVNQWHEILGSTLEDRNHKPAQDR